MSLYGPRFPRRQNTLREFNGHPSFWNRFERGQVEKDLARDEREHDEMAARRDAQQQRQEVEHS